MNRVNFYNTNNYCDYIPIVSTFKGLYCIFSNCKKNSIKERPVRNLLRLIPVIGNLSLYILDKKYQNFSKNGPRFRINPDATIFNGSGEFIVYNINGSPIDRKTYDEAYKILSSVRHIKDKNFSKRHKIAAKRVKELDPSLRIKFIPRTLYEMILLRKGVEEDLQAGSNCYCSLDEGDKRQFIQQKEYKNYPYTREDLIKQYGIQAIDRECWHISKEFKDYTIENEREEAVVNLAFKVNRHITTLFSKDDLEEEGLPFHKIMRLADDQLHYFEKIYEQAEKFKFSSKFRSSTNKFIYYRKNNHILLSKDTHKSPIVKAEQQLLIKKMIHLECHEIAKSHLLLVRSAVHSMDSLQDEDGERSLSYGSSLFAGYHFDGGASTWALAKDWKDCFVTPVKMTDLEKSPFTYPTIHPICQLFSSGENFHGRTKISVNSLKSNGGGGMPYHATRSNHNLKTLNRQFQSYHKQAIFLHRAAAENDH